MNTKTLMVSFQTLRLVVTLFALAITGCNDPCWGLDGAELEKCQAEQEQKKADENRVWAWGEKDDEGALESGEWIVDSAAGAYSGATTVHPPKYDAGDSFAFSFDCGGRDHTQLRFVLDKALSADLELAVSGEDELRVLPRTTHDTNKRWSDLVVNVEPGKHTYTLRASSDNDSDPDVFVDAISCWNFEPLDAEGQVDFDDGFIPQEVAGAWQIDNLQGPAEGGGAIHTPAFSAGDEYTMQVTCAAPDHSQLRFTLDKASDANLELTISGEDEPRVLPGTTHDTNKRWSELVVNVEPGTHTYTFRAWSDKDFSPIISIDSIKCLSNEPMSAVNGRVDFDDGIVPEEVAGDWKVDNLQGPAEGDGAIHTPVFSAGDQYTMQVTCAAANHSQLRFTLDKASDANLELTVSGEDEPRVLPGTTHDTNKRWSELVVNVEPGTHTYTFRAWSDKDFSPIISIDSIECLSNEPSPAKNGRIDFDAGFIPREISGEWHVDNSLGVVDGEAAIHPPALSAGDEFTMELVCSGESHKQLRFTLDKASNANLELIVAGEDRPRELPATTHDTNKRWSEVVVGVEPGPHIYAFRTWSEEGASPIVVLDSFVCE